MPRTQLHTLISLINRSRDIGDGWRECSDICWQLVKEHQAEEDIFNMDHNLQRVRLKPKNHKPTMEDLLNQIYEWHEKAWLELKIHDRKIEAQKRAANIFD